MAGWKGELIRFEDECLRHGALRRSRASHGSFDELDDEVRDEENRESLLRGVCDCAAEEDWNRAG